MKDHKLKRLILFLSFLLITQNAIAMTPTDTVKEKVSGIISAVTEAKKNQTLSEKATEEKLWSLVDAIFDYTLLSQKSLSRNWLAMNDGEQAEFVSLFRKLLSRSYLNKIKSYDNENIQYSKEVFLSPENSEVFTQIESKGQQLALNYRLIQKNGQWKVYDVSIEGISLMSNYRSQFSSFLQKNTIQELLSSLRTKVESNEDSKK